MELIAQPLEQLHLQAGESPRWDARHNLLALVDLHEHRVVFLHENKVERVPLPGRTGMIAPSATGGWLVSVEGGIRILDDNRQLGPELCPVAAPGLRLNDGRCDAAGRLWVGSYGDRWDVGACAFYRVTKDGTVTQIFGAITCSNGLGWSPDGRTLYYIDSGTWRVDACPFDPEQGTVGARQPVVMIPQAQGVPDGMAVDAVGMIWVAILNGRANDGLVLRCNPKNGAVIGRVLVPGAGRVTACAFGGIDLQDLYITTMRDPKAARQQPNDGRVFRVRVPIAGQSERAWQGPAVRACAGLYREKVNLGSNQ